jgi:hypothetical protein
MHARDTGGEMHTWSHLSLVIQRSANPVKCRRRTPPRWKIGKKWFCGYPKIRPCNGPGPLPGHHRTNFPGTRKTAEPDPGEKASETRPEGDRSRDPTSEVLERLVAYISRHWLGDYAGLESLPGVVGTAMMDVSTAEIVMSTAVRISVLYAWKGPGPWMASAVWGTAFQMITMPGRWALEWGRDQGEVTSQAMEARVGGENLPMDGGGTGSSN